MPQWIHDRAKHLLAKNPSMNKGQAFAIATQQSHKLGKSPKGYGTSEGKKDAKAKYDKPKKEYKKTPNPGDLDSPKLGSVLAGLVKEGVAGDSYSLLDQVGKSKTKPREAEAPNPTYRVKKASFATSQYSGTLGPGKFNFYASHVPPFRSPQLRTASASEEELAMAQKEMKKQDKSWTPLSKMGAMLDELSKLNAVQSPEAQITQSQKIGAPKTTAPPGPSIQQISKPIGYGRPQPGTTKTAMEKAAIIEEGVRLLMKDVPGTPRLLMRHRNKLERALAGRQAHNWVESTVASKVRGAAKPLVDKLPDDVKNPLHGKQWGSGVLRRLGKSEKISPRGAAHAAVDLLAEDPVSTLTAKSLMVGLPTLGPVGMAAAGLPIDPMLRGLKQGATKAIDRIDPVSAEVAARLPLKLKGVGW